jgi:hypothetical protein
MFKLCIYWHWLHQVIIFIKKLLMFSWFMKPYFSLATCQKRGQKYFPPPSIFKCREGNCHQLFRPWSGISEVRTVDSYGASEFMSVRIFSCLCVSVFSFLGIRNFLSAIKYLSFCHVILVYLYHIFFIKVIYWPFKFKTI